MPDSRSTENYPQRALGKSLLLHVTPGIVVTGAFLALKPLADAIGYPPLMAFLLAVVLTDVPFMLAMMLNAGKRLHGRFTLERVVLYRERVSWKAAVSRIGWQRKAVSLSRRARASSSRGLLPGW